MSDASRRAFFALLAMASAGAGAVGGAFDVRNWWLGVEPYDAAAADVLEQWLLE